MPIFKRLTTRTKNSDLRPKFPLMNYDGHVFNVCYMYVHSAIKPVICFKYSLMPFTPYMLKRLDTCMQSNKLFQMWHVK